MVTEIVNTIPGMGTNSFVIPSTSQIAIFESVFSEMKVKNFTAVQNLITPFGYNLILFNNLPTADTFYIIKENTPVQRGWGTYIFNARTTNDLAIEVPHPLWDRYTWKMGIKVFIGAKAQWFNMSGTHRYANTDSSSDVAHVTKSVFHAAHRIQANATAVQVHGFDGSSPTYTGYPDAVISNGTLYPTTVYYTLRDKYTDQGFTAGVFSYSTYNQLKQLGATTNTQGSWSNSNSKKFVHIEHDQPLRFDTTNLKKSASAIINTFGSTTGVTRDTTMVQSHHVISAYPNPFNPSTTITVTVAEAGEILLMIHDVLGRTQQILFKGHITSGIHTFRYNAQALSGGVYFCTILSQKHVQTTKLILLK